MAGTGCTISFLRKRMAMGDTTVSVVSFLASAVSGNIAKNDLKLKSIEFMVLGARSFTSGQNIIRQNIRSGTTVEAGTIHFESFTIGDDVVIALYGR